MKKKKVDENISVTQKEEKVLESQPVAEKAVEEKAVEEKAVEEKPTEEKPAEEKSADETPVKGKSKGKKIAMFAICAVVVVLLAYSGIALYYQSHFLPNTVLNGVDCSNDDVAEAVEVLEAQYQGYALEVSGRVDEDGTKESLGKISAQDIELHPVNTAATVENLLARQNEWLWIEAYLGDEFVYSATNDVAFDEELLSQVISSWDASKKRNMKKPQDAYISDYLEKEERYEIIPDTIGTTLDMDAVMEAVKTAIVAYDTQVDLEERNCYKTAKITAQDSQLIKYLETANKWLDTEITYDWNSNEVILNKEQIHEWITFQKNKPELDEEAVADFVAEHAKKFDTYGKKRNFMTSLGVEVTLANGGYGWKTDRKGETEELLQLIKQGSVQDREPIYTYMAAHKGANDIGSSYVEADLTNQHLYLYYDGALVLETDFVSGSLAREGSVTPPGLFGLTYKTTDAVLRGRDYTTPVKYWMPFNGNVGMHDATWRNTFGGDIYVTNGSHGCINLPLSAAKTIYEYISTGFPVICYYY